MRLADAGDAPEREEHIAVVAAEDVLEVSHDGTHVLELFQFSELGVDAVDAGSEREQVRRNEHGEVGRVREHEAVSQHVPQLLVDELFAEACEEAITA